MTPEQLPPLPEARPASEWTHDMYTADQMHAYATAATAALRAEPVMTRKRKSRRVTVVTPVCNDCHKPPNVELSR
jgi:hypothetical protein